MTYPRIHKIVSGKDYVGSEASLRMFMQEERIRMLEKTLNSDVKLFKKTEKLNEWLHKLEAFDIPKIQINMEGIRKDIKAVKSRIALPYNNRLIEGNVNKIKVIKRIMYERNSFELLKAKYCFMKNFTANSTKDGKKRLPTYNYYI